MITCFIHPEPPIATDLSVIFLNLLRIWNLIRQIGHFRENLWPVFMIHHFHPHLDVILNTLAMAKSNSDIDTDILAKIQVSFTNFLESGQAGAMTIGVIFGYVVRGITK
jgi:hypothetical protein